ncbi:hypothetical protein HIM_10087 [Hirsutella minnesotensis 3608]|uniref:Uncharacterized protein n=1 Tax=Hirsutella minnesotensis 3608 TaxID=1043627 RepID=A0A0F7ZS09_9HYPO|nr:hypothetical protein HIM_10087 [Hirsutella minnesotensis 3608]
MVGVADLVADMCFIAGRIEAIPAKLQRPGIRPSSQEVAKLHGLIVEIVQQAKALERKLAECATGWTSEVYQKADDHMSRARPAIQAISQGQIKGPILRRNLVAIFQGPQISSVDSPKVKMRKKSRAQRCETLRGLEPAIILAWGASLPPSIWEEMDRLVFNDLIKQVAVEAIIDLPFSVREIVSSLTREEPFCSIAAYRSFVLAVENLASSAPAHQPKRQRLDKYGSPQGQPMPDPSPDGGIDSVWSDPGTRPMTWTGVVPNELQVNDGQNFSLSLSQLRFDVPDEKVVDLLGLRTTKLDHGLPPITLTVPFDGNPAFVFFNVPRETAFLYAHEIGWKPSWFGPIAW